MTEFESIDRIIGPNDPSTLIPWRTEDIVLGRSSKGKKRKHKLRANVRVWVGDRDEQKWTDAGTSDWSYYGDTRFYAAYWEAEYQRRAIAKVYEEMVPKLLRQSNIADWWLTFSPKDGINPNPKERASP